MLGNEFDLAESRSDIPKSIATSMPVRDFDLVEVPRLHSNAVSEEVALFAQKNGYDVKFNENNGMFSFAKNQDEQSAGSDEDYDFGPGAEVISVEETGGADERTTGGYSLKKNINY